jgi:hypothetical protein
MTDSDPESLRLHVSVGDVTIEVDGPVDEAETWFEALREDYLEGVDIEAAASSSSSQESSSVETESVENNGTTTESSNTKQRSLPEYYKMADSPSKRDSALLVGWYLEYVDQQDDFTKSEIGDTAKSAKITLGKNLSRDLRNQVGDGNLLEVGERGGETAYHLTITGEEYVEGELLEL